MTDIIIAEAVRSAVGRAKKGSLANTRPDELMGAVVRGLMKRVPQVKPEMVGDIIIGCAMPEGEQGLNIARIAGVLADLPIEMSAMTINRFCSSGLQAIASAAGAIAFGQEDIIIAGGVESMTFVPMGGFHLSYSPELMEKCPTAATPMGITSENVAKQFKITREMQDAFALESQQKAQAAIKAGKFKDETVPVNAIR
ncbi:MAG: acetyl-CoA C-acyltransferase, partial [Deltaproteobacteria bacterium]